MAKDALDRSLDLDPLSATGHIELGGYYYYGFLDYKNSLKKYEIAKRVGPKHVKEKKLIAIGQKLLKHPQKQIKQI